MGCSKVLLKWCVCICVLVCVCVCVFGGGVGGRFENVVEIAMLISTLVILGLQSKGKMASGWKMEKGVTYG